MIFEAAVDLSITDNTAFTVLVALKQLGYESLARVERSEIFRLTLADDESPENVARALVHAEVVFNPNKHRLSYAVNDLDTGDGAAAVEWEAIVADRDDDTTRLVRVLAERFGVRGLIMVERSTSWRLYESGRPASKDRLEWACRTLLCNPHSQIATIRARPHRVAAGATVASVER